MALRNLVTILGLGLWLAACGGDGGGNRAAAPAANEAVAANESAGAETAGTSPAVPACPYRRTQEWIGSVEGGRVLVTGNVDLQMAGFRPALTERPGAAAGTLALDLALTPEPNAPVTDVARYERRGAPAYRRGEIWCGGQRIAAFDMIHV